MKYEIEFVGKKENEIIGCDEMMIQKNQFGDNVIFFLKNKKDNSEEQFVEYYVYADDVKLVARDYSDKEITYYPDEEFVIAVMYLKNIGKYDETNYIKGFKATSWTPGMDTFEIVEFFNAKGLLVATVDIRDVDSLKVCRASISEDKDINDWPEMLSVDNDDTISIVTPESVDDI